MVFRSVLALEVLFHITSHVCVFLQEFDGEIAGGESGADVLVGFQELLNVGDAVLDLVAIVDVDVACLLMSPFKDINNCLEQVLYASSALEGRGHHGNAEEGGECI